MFATNQDALVALESGDVLLESDLSVGEGIEEDGLLLNGDREWVSGEGERLALDEDDRGAAIEASEVLYGFDRGDLADFCI